MLTKEDNLTRYW